MAHPQMYDEDDPTLARVRAVCLALPETSEKVSHGRPTFWAGRRVFAIYGMASEHSSHLLFHPHDDERPALMADGRFVVPPYWGPGGWLAIDLAEHVGTDPAAWQEVAELVEESYRRVALKRMLAALEQ